MGHFFEDMEEFESKSDWLSPSKYARNLGAAFGDGISIGIKPYYTFKNGSYIFPKRIDPELFRKAYESFENSMLVPDVVKLGICLNEYEQFLHYLRTNNYMKEFEDMAIKYGCEVPNPPTNKSVKASAGDFRWCVRDITLERSIDISRVELTLSGYSEMFMQRDFDPRLLAGEVTGALNHHGKTSSLQIKDVIFNPPATIVFWADGSKTVVKCRNENFDPEKGLAMAYFKKTHGDKYEYYDEMRKWVGRYEKKLKKSKNM